jgi:hypothetical protein
LIICYHGTNRVNAKSILKRGFPPCTYFAAHLEDAVGYGGNHVFEVAFHKAPDKWQFMCPVRAQPSMIVSYTVYTTRVKFRNESLRKKVFKSNIGRSRSDKRSITRREPRRYTGCIPSESVSQATRERLPSHTTR